MNNTQLSDNLIFQLPVVLQPLQSPLFNNISIDVLRLDTIHPIVSGNKWFKLKYYIEDCKQQEKNSIATFGGAYSNHIVATAFACKEAKIKSIGIIRGEANNFLSHTLQDAKNYGMELHFVSRNNFNEKETIKNKFDKNIYWINEGGYGILGAKGAATILQTAPTENYTHILCACGTGTMLAGIVKDAQPHQKIWGISVFKNNHSLEQEIKNILPNYKQNSFSILHQYHFGGYAKHPLTLINWMNELYQKENLPTDIIYTSKLLFAVKDLCCNNTFSSTDKLLIIHSGGLQGNLSLAPNTLRF